MKSILEVENLNVRFNESSVIKDISFEVNQGDILAIIGPNGAGKTVLFKTLLKLIPYEGEIKWREGIKIGYVPQTLVIEKDLPVSVFEFLKFKNVAQKEIFEALEAVGFLKPAEEHDKHHLYHHLLDIKLGNLSGGELQRVLIAYAIIGHPNVLLFDEPTSGVDIGGEETIYSLLEKLHHKHGLTTILISHDLNIIYRYASNVLCLNKKKICYGTPKEVLTPEALEKLYGTKIGIYAHKH